MSRVRSLTAIPVLAIVVITTLAGLAPGSALASGWSIQSTPNPTGVSGSALQAVSCPSASACVTVGDVNGVSGPVGPLAEQWNGTAWTILPNPTGQSLTGVSCVSAAACTAVGPGAYGWNRNAWSTQPTPSKGNNGSFLNDVSCTAVNACSAVGYYRNYQQRFVYTFTLAEQWNGTGWSIQSTPNPNTFDSVLDAVSCTSATACTAVGSGVNAPLVERWNGAGWAIQSTPKPASATGETVLFGVSCPKATDCTAVGSYTSATAYAPLVEHWNGSTWTIQAIPSPAGAANTVLRHVACTSASACIAVGWSSAGALVERWNGTAWSIQSAPAPAGSVLSGVSCPTATSCTAVGSYANATGTQVTLAESYSG